MIEQCSNGSILATNDVTRISFHISFWVIIRFICSVENILYLWRKMNRIELHLGSCLNHVDFPIPDDTFDVLWRSIELLNGMACFSNARED